MLPAQPVIVRYRWDSEAAQAQPLDLQPDRSYLVPLLQTAQPNLQTAGLRIRPLAWS